jgi:pyridoxamine 5'-phosphate oxidase
MKQAEIAAMRQDYTVGELMEDTSPLEPWELFSNWFAIARKAEMLEPNAMILSTVSKEGQPTSRVVLLKDFDVGGLVFFTNYLSQKGEQLSNEPRASILFWWEPLQRQIRIEGEARKVDEGESDEYFESRPHGSRLGAWVSEQSRTIDGRTLLEKRKTEFEKKFSDGNVSRPDHWGGYRLVPNKFEFWQGRSNRLHDRLLYSNEKSTWVRVRLAP